MDLRGFEQFIAVAEEKHFGRAAERLHMSQPPLSQAIRRLEDELGVRLLARTSRSVELTVAGEIFLKEIRRALIQIETAKTLTRQTVAGLLGTLRVAFNVSALQLIPKILTDFRRMVPNVNLDLEEMRTSEQVKAISEAEVDVGFLRSTVFNAPQVEEIVFEPLFQHRFVAALPVNHQLGKLKKISLAQLKDEHFIVTGSIMKPNYMGPSLYSHTIRACQEAGFTPKIIQQVDHLQTVCILVASGMGVALIPPSPPSMRPAGIVYKELRDSSTLLDIHIGMAWNRKNESPALPVFVDVARQVSASVSV